MEPNKSLLSYFLHPLIDVICGALAGAAGNLTGHPLDTIKLRKQISQKQASSFQIFRKIRAKQGVRLNHLQLAGFFKGVEAPILATMPLNATAFTVNTAMNNLLASSEVPKFKLNFFTGLVSGFVATFVNVPFEVMKVQMQKEKKR